MWLHSLKVAQLLRSAACLYTNQSRSYLNHLVHEDLTAGICRECLSAQKRTQTTGGLHLGCDVYDVLMVLGDLTTLFQLRILYNVELFGIGSLKLCVSKDL